MRGATMSSQVIRVEQFIKGSLSNIGNEVERKSVKHRNEDIDDERKALNIVYKSSDGSMRKAWQKMQADLNFQFRETKKAVAFEGMIITSDTQFFQTLGWRVGEPAPRVVQRFFDEAYAFVLRTIGYQGTDKNILSAVVHMDEKTPHLQLYYVPLVDRWKDKVYAKGDDGKVLRNDKGSPIQARDDNGVYLYTEVTDETRPKLSRSEFWKQRGGNQSYSMLQDDFYESISVRYGLGRGEVGSTKKHKTKAQWETEQLRASANREKQAIEDLSTRKEKLSREVQEISELHTAVMSATDKPVPKKKKQAAEEITALRAQNAMQERELARSKNDRADLFREMTTHKKRADAYEKAFDMITEIRSEFPDELDELYRSAKAEKAQRRLREQEKIRARKHSYGKDNGMQM